MMPWKDSWCSFTSLPPGPSWEGSEVLFPSCVDSDLENCLAVPSFGVQLSSGDFQIEHINAKSPGGA